MEYGVVSTMSIEGMAFSMIISIGVPVLLFVLLLVKKKAKASSFFIGCGTFLAFALVLEQILHRIVLGVTGTAITDNPWLYALYGGLAAALFEETGRLIAMKFLMKNNLDAKNALMYGAGHGGFEAIVIVGLTEINNIAAAIMINNGLFEQSLEVLDESMRLEAYNQVSALWTLSPALFYMAGLERVLAIAGHIAMSFMVFMGIKYSKKAFIALAYGCHFLLDALTVIVNNLTENILVVEGVLLIVVALMGVAAKLIWDKNEPKTEEKKEVNKKFPTEEIKKAAELSGKDDE